MFSKNARAALWSQVRCGRAADREPKGALTERGGGGGGGGGVVSAAPRHTVAEMVPAHGALLFSRFQAP